MNRPTRKLDVARAKVSMTELMRKLDAVYNKTCGNKNCNRSGEHLDLDEFYFHPHTATNRQSWCKECIREHSQKQRDRKRLK